MIRGLSIFDLPAWAKVTIAVVPLQHGANDLPHWMRGKEHALGLIGADVPDRGHAGDAGRISV